MKRTFFFSIELSLHGYISKYQQLFLAGKTDVIVMDGCRQGNRHTKYDLTKLKDSLQKLLDEPRMAELEAFEKLSDPPQALLENIVDCL